jgi:dipeptidyl aminopeptidase/acylaminoacyl peptidase
MALAPGTTLGTYEIIDQIGAGGMGEVYRARDTKLGRGVAIKVLPEALAFDHERVARLEREAKVLASLNHPHIAALYGMDVADDRPFLIMELVEGETLADRLAHGRLQVDEALRIAIQIAEALDGAHEQGIVHRDLKPANIKLTPADKVKVLDFGLAKAIETAPAAAANITQSPTLSLMATQTGMILGTAAYMSPEQAKGASADHRSDVFSFGCVLYEMLTGRQTFQADSAAEILAAVLMREPDLSQLPPNMNHRIADTLRRCFEKNPKRRWQAVGDLRAELEGIAVAPHGAPATNVAMTPRPLWKRALPVAVALMVGAAVMGIAMRVSRPSPAPPIVTRFPLTLPEGGGYGAPQRTNVAISPDGTQVLYVASNQFYVRSMSEPDPRPVPGTNFGNNPVFSPDGRSVAFFYVTGGDRALKRIDVRGGVAVTICQVDTTSFGLSWAGDSILFGESDKGVMRVPAQGGKPELLIEVKSGEIAHAPQMLPDGEHVLFTLAKGASPDHWDKAQIVVQSLKSRERKTVIDGGSDGRFLPTGHIVYAQEGVLYAIPFDASRLRAVAGPTPIVEGVGRSTGGATGAAHFSVSSNGSLAYLPGPRAPSSGAVGLAVLDREGDTTPLKIAPGPYEVPRVSPDGTRVAVGTDDGKEANIWIYELSGATSLRRLTNGGRNRFPVWSHDGERVAFQSNREGDLGIFWQRADGVGGVERLTKPDKDISHIPHAWSPDGRHLLFDLTSGSSVALMSMSLPDKKVGPYGGIQSEAPIVPDFSPDGQWITYTAVAGRGAGQPAVYVRSFATGANYLVAPGIHSLWSSDGKELLYRARGQTFAVRVSTQSGFSFGNPTPVKAGDRLRQAYIGGGLSERHYDLAPDGKFVAVVGSSDAIGTQPIQVVLNWFEELKRLVPTN